MIRLAKTADLDAIDALSVKTITAMHQQGLHQWTTNYPRSPHFKDDISHNRLYIYETDNKILGVMALYGENEESYRNLSWMKQQSLVIHRIMVDPDARGQGIASGFLSYAINQCKTANKHSLKIDTHPSNNAMNALLKKHQFQYIGYLKSIHRLAYERLIDFSFMKKVLIFGNAGTGKTTLARMLGDKLNLNVLHLDTVYWLKDWQSMDKELFKQKVRRYLKHHPRFVMDGNYTNSQTFEDRIRIADTIILLKYPKQSALKGVIEREKEYKHRYRSDMATGCIEELDQEFLQYVAFFDKKKKKLEAVLNSLKHQKNILIFDSRDALMQWFNSL